MLSGSERVLEILTKKSLNKLLTVDSSDTMQEFSNKEIFSSGPENLVEKGLQTFQNDFPESEFRLPKKRFFL